MSYLPKSIQNLTDELAKLPGVGPKTASRLTFYLLTKPDLEIKNLGEAFLDLKKNLVTCSICFNVAESDPCAICADPKRDHTKICVVEEPLDVIAIEKTNFGGVYHVLGGVISPINGIGPDELRIKQLLDRITREKDKLTEIILATNPSLEGEATAVYIQGQIEKQKNNDSEIKKIKITRIARGLPIGGDLEYADEMTLERAFEGRREY